MLIGIKSPQITQTKKHKGLRVFGDCIKITTNRLETVLDTIHSKLIDDLCFFNGRIVRKDGELDPDKPQAFRAWVVNWIPTGKWKVRKGDVTNWTREYNEALEFGSATGISDETRELAYIICLMQ